MPDKNAKFEDNVRGKYYVDEECIDCNLCNEISPSVFMRNDEAGHDFVYKQPETKEELDLTQDAIDSCPVEAIGDDGD